MPQLFLLFMNECVYWLNNASSWSWSIHVRILISIKSCDGDNPVVVCCVIRYCNRNLHKRKSKGPSSFVSECLNVCTACSMRPLDDGCYGEVKVCLIPLLHVES